MDRLVELAQLSLGLASGRAYGAEEEGGRCFVQTRDRDRHELIRVLGCACQRDESVHGDPPTAWSEAGGAAGDLGRGIGQHDGRVRSEDGGLRESADRVTRSTDDRQPADRLDDRPVGPILGSSEQLPPSAERIRCGRDVPGQQLVPATLHHGSALQEILSNVQNRARNRKGEQAGYRSEDEPAGDHGPTTTPPSAGHRFGGVLTRIRRDSRPPLRAAPHMVSDRSCRASNRHVMLLVGSNRSSRLLGSPRSTGVDARFPSSRGRPAGPR